MNDISILVDASYKSQMRLTDKYGDLFIDILQKQDLLTQTYLETQPVKQILKLFRGFTHMSSENLSDANRNQLNQLMETFIRSEIASQNMQPTMWLSVIDCTEKAEMEDLQTYARAMFYDTFDWIDLQTTSVGSQKKDKEEESPS